MLFLGGSAAADNPQIQVHGDHFVPSAVSGNATIISFLTNSIGSNVANMPVSASSGGETFRFEGATPVRTSISPGPIYAERAQTLGSGRLFVSLSRTGLHYETLRGVPLDAVPLVFTHANVDFPDCDAIFGGDCTALRHPRVRERGHRLHARPGRERGRHRVRAHLRHQRPDRSRRGAAGGEDLAPRHQHRHHHPLRRRPARRRTSSPAPRTIRSSRPAASSRAPRPAWATCRRG